MIKVYMFNPELITSGFSLTYKIFALSLLDVFGVIPDQGSVPLPLP